MEKENKEKRLWVKEVWNFIQKYNLITYAGIFYLTVSNLTFRQNDKLLRNEITELKTEMAQMQAQNIKLISDMVFYNRSFEDFPYPIWQKAKRGGTFVMQWYNEVYWETYLKDDGIDRFGFFGKTDFDIYDKDVAQLYYTRDYILYLDGGVKRFEEFVRDKKTRLRLPIDVVKWRVIERSDTLIYGMVIPPKKKR